MGILDGKIAVITGGTRGFGLAMARAYLAEGARVVICSRSGEAVATALAQLEPADARVVGFVCDVSSLDSVFTLREQALTAFERIDIWINNAGVSGPSGPTASIPPDQFLTVLQTNVLGVYHGSLVALRYFAPRRAGKVINILGQGDRRPQPFASGYSASKAWARSFTQALAKEYAGSGVGIYTFNPGMMYTYLMTHVDVVAGYEDRLRPLETIMRMWARDPGGPAQKAVWLAGPSTDGRTGLEVRYMTFWSMLVGASREGVRQLFHRPVPADVLRFRSIPPDGDSDPAG